MQWRSASAWSGGRNSQALTFLSVVICDVTSKSVYFIEIELKMWESYFEESGEPKLEGFDLTNLKTDESLVEITTNINRKLTLYQKSSLCEGCPFSRSGAVEAKNPLNLILNSDQLWSFIASKNDSEYIFESNHESNSICQLQDLKIGQFGVYQLSVTDDSCDFVTLKQPVFKYGAIIMTSVVVTVLFVLWYLLDCLFKTCKRNIDRNRAVHEINTVQVGNGSLKNDQDSTNHKRIRLKSLDTFRGITIALMILVNHGGGGYWFLQHPPWDGFRLADVVFPWFMWIMGVCIPMGIISQLKKEVPRCTMFKRIILRSLKLFAIGIILNSIGGHNRLETYRIPGVLQRFAISYLVCAGLATFLYPSKDRNKLSGFLGKFDDIILLIPQWVIHILIVIGHTLIIFLIDVPGCPRGYLGPGGISLFQDGKPSPDCIGGVTRIADTLLLGSSHLYQGLSTGTIYKASPFDPEGILGSLTTIFQTFLGMQAGQILMSFDDHRSRIKRWIIWGLITCAGGLALSGGHLLGDPIPVNKSLWSLSFVLVTSSLAFFLLCICYALVDYRPIWTGSPFYQAGMNSLFLYVGHFFTYNVFPWHFQVGNMNTHMAKFSVAFYGMLLWLCVARYLHYKGKFYTV